MIKVYKFYNIYIIYKYWSETNKNNFNHLKDTIFTMCSISDDTYNNILSLLEQGVSIRKIADQHHISKSKIQKIRAEYLPNLISSQGGRPTKLSAQNKRFCIREIISGRSKTGTDVRKRLEADTGIKVCDRTVRNAFREAGLAAVEKETKPMLSPANIKARLEFAKSHQNWTVDDWKRIIWSDEKKSIVFAQMDVHGAGFVMERADNHIMSNKK